MSEIDEPVASPAVMGEIASLPVFWKLAGRSVMLAGSGDGLLWKADLVAATGARLEIYCCEPARWLALAASRPAVRLHQRRWAAADFINVALAIGDFEAESEAIEFAAAARAANVPVNVVDRRDYCDFEFGALVDRSPLLIAISTDGAAPILAQTLRGRIEALLPDLFRHWVVAARAWRPLVQERWSDRPRRRRFWEAFAAAALAHPERRPTDADRERLFADVAGQAGGSAGTLTIVGTGPGDPELLTLRALRALQSAERVVYEPSVAFEVIAMSRREAIKMTADEVQRARSGDIAASRIEAVAVLARNAENIVYLIAGDPRNDVLLVAAVDALRAQGQIVEIVAGISGE